MKEFVPCPAVKIMQLCLGIVIEFSLSLSVCVCVCRAPRRYGRVC